MDKKRYFVHYKGGLYQMIGIVRHSETLEEMVLYQALYGNHEIWVRPITMFFDMVTQDGVGVERFKEITENEMSCLLLKKNENI